MDNERITLAHGAGGQQTAALIERLFARHFTSRRTTPPSSHSTAHASP